MIYDDEMSVDHTSIMLFYIYNIFSFSQLGIKAVNSNAISDSSTHFVVIFALDKEAEMRWVGTVS